MSQYDFGTIDPNTKSGTALASDLNSFRTALHTSHSGSSAPSYITTGMLWVDSTSANLKIKMYDGAQSIDVAIIDATNNVARVAVDSAATSYITSTVAAQIKFVIASVDTATIRSTGLQFNIASPYIGDSSNNELLSFTTTASAVNQINVANAATATNPVISAIGNDTNIGITLTPKGTGRTNIGQLALDGTTITTTAAQLNFVTGVTSAIQTQIDGKAPLTGTGTSGTWPISITGDAATTDGISIGTLTAAGGIAYATSTTALAATAAGTAGQALVSGGAGAPTWSTIATGGMTLLGTITTTSGSTQTLSGLTLTGYIGLIAVFNGVGHVSTNSTYTFANCSIGTTVIAGAGQYRGIVNIDLATGSGVSTLASLTAAAPSSTGVTQQVILRTNITTASTSISMTTSASTFNAGSISIYGVK